MNKAEEDSLAKSRKINAQKEAKRDKAIMKTRKANKKALKLVSKKADKATSALMKKWGYNLQGKPLKKSAAKGKKSADKGKKSTAKGKKSAAKGKTGVNAKAAAEKKKIDSAAKKAGVLQAKRKKR